MRPIIQECFLGSAEEGKDDTTTAMELVAEELEPVVAPKARMGRNPATGDY